MIQFCQRGKFRGGLVNFLREFFAIRIIARVLNRHEKRGQLTLFIRVQCGQFSFEYFDAHGVMLSLNLWKSIPVRRTTNGSPVARGFPIFPAHEINDGLRAG